jgi:predicted transcriptional regulator
MDLSIPTPDDIEKAAGRLGISVASLCRKADVAAELFYRWRKGGAITTATLSRLLGAIRQAEMSGEGDE